jgi:hypothetical protein
MCSKILSIPTAGGKLFLRLENAPSNVAGPARDFRSGSEYPYSSRRSHVGNETVTDIHLSLKNP